MSDYLPPIVTKLDGDNSGLARSLAESEAMVDEYGKNVEESVKQHSEKAGTEGGKTLSDHFEEEASKGVSRLRDEKGRFRSELDDALGEGGDSSGKSFASRAMSSITSAFSGGMDKISGKAPEGLVQWLVLAAVLAAPAIGAAVNAAVLLGVGGGGLAIGIAAAFSDDRVKNAWKDQLSDIWSGFKTASEPLMQPLIDGAHRIGSAFQTFMPSITAAFEKAAPTIDHLTAGIAGLIEKAGPGFAHAFDAALPVLNALGDELPALGESISYFFNVMAENGPGATQFLHDFMTGLDQLIRGTANLIGALTSVYEWLRSNPIGEAFTGVLGPLFTKMEEGSKGVTAAWHDQSDAADDSAAATKRAADALSTYVDEAFKMQDSQIAIARGLIEVGKSFDENGRSIDINTEKGNRNRSALQSQVEQLARWRQDQLDAGAAPEKVNAALDVQIEALRKAAEAHGGDKKAIDALILSWEQMLKLPSSKTFSTTYLTTTIDSHYTRSGEYNQQVPKFRYGGIQHAAQGLVTQPGIYQGMGSGAVVAFEGPTGKEGFVPQRGISQPRAYDLISEMAAWHDIPVGPPGGSVGQGSRSSGASGGGRGVPIVVQFVVDGRVFHEQVVMPAAQQYKDYAGSTGLT